MHGRSILALVLGITALGCGGAEPEPVVPPPPPPAAPATAAAPPPDPAPAPAAEAPPADPTKALLSYIEAFNGGQLEQAAEAFTNGAEWISAGSLVRPATGRSEIVRGWKEQKDVFGIKLGVRRLFLTDGLWVAQTVVHGSHVGAFDKLKPTNKPVGVDHVHIGWVEGGKIAKLMSLSNGKAFMTQIGFDKGKAIPVAAPPAGQPEVIKGAGDPKNLAAYEAMVKALGSGDVAAWSANVAPTAVWNDRAAGKTVTGLDGIKKALSIEVKATTNVQRDMKTFAAGPYVVSHGMISGQPTKVKPAATTRFHTVEVVKFEGGKATELDRYVNAAEE